MRARDLFIVGTVALLVAVAALDTVRRDGGGPAPVAPARATTTPERPADEPVAATLPRGLLDGELVFTEIVPEGCRLRVAYLRSGEMRGFPQDTPGCFLAAPPTGRAVAKSLDESFEDDDALTFRIIDPAHADRDFLEVRARYGDVAWRPDGRRALWCTPDVSGYEVELPRTIRRLDDCPDAYTNDGDHAYLRGRRLVVGRRVVAETVGPIHEASWSANGSIGLVVGGRRLERWWRGQREGMAVLPDAALRRPVHFSPDNCAALVVGDGEVHIVDVGCFRGRDSFVTASPDNCVDRRSAVIVRCFRWQTPSSFPGNAATWSPDGNWIAVAEQDAISFHRVVGRYTTIRWDVRAAAVAWR